MIAALLAVPVTAGAATPATASYPATYSACPSGLIPASSFTDTTGSFAASDIDCIAYYGISKGTSSTTFDPSSAVTREQMALFLIRAAGPAGVTVPAATAQGFTDISGLSQESQDAINQLAALGITKGTSPTTYSPAGTVTRQQMALFINRFLGKATAGPGGMYAAADASTTKAVDFTDIGGVTFEAHTAILNLFELGVTTGTTATTFSPSMAVSRDQMAAFIARGLAHTNARPAGLVMQTNLTSGYGVPNPILSITYRDANFMPAANVLVDIFRFVPSTTVTSAFKTDGTCVTTGEVTPVSSGANVCKIDLTDAATNADGNISWGWTVPLGKTGTFYAWTGATGAAFDNDTTASSSVTVTSLVDATTVKTSTDLPANATAAKFGSTVTITAQLTDGTDPVAKAGVAVKFVQTRKYNSATLFTNTYTVNTDAAGKATFAITATDPDSAGTDVYNDSVVITSGSLTIVSSPVTVDFKDTASVATTLKLAVGSDYVLASATGASNSATATLYDQYGIGMSGQTVAFSSDDSSGIGTGPVNRITNASGAASVGWTRANATSGLETVTAKVGTLLTSTAKAYWVVAGVGGTSSAADAILVADTANNKIVIQQAAANFTTTAGDYVLLTYKDSDQFNSGGGAITVDAFETLLDDTTADNISVVYNPAGISSWTRS